MNGIVIAVLSESLGILWFFGLAPGSLWLEGAALDLQLAGFPSLSVSSLTFFYFSPPIPSKVNQERHFLTLKKQNKNKTPPQLVNIKNELFLTSWLETLSETEI